MTYEFTMEVILRDPDGKEVDKHKKQISYNRQDLDRNWPLEQDSTARNYLHHNLDEVFDEISMKCQYYIQECDVAYIRANMKE